ncbi:MAG: hypothetical protein GYB67_00450 [Chloroflexi bacterium]|nr:hypothetical protein [Chloroflexota bacterium]
MNDPKKRTAATETGMMPRIDDEPMSAHEPPQPDTLPEFDDLGATGVMPAFAEGEDAAKHADDSASATDSQSDLEETVH